MPFSKEDVVGFECKHVHYNEANDRSPNDIVFIKEQVHLKDGTVVPNVRIRENFKRPFWVTRELHRNHKDKKEWEKIDRLQPFQTTQVNLIKNASRALNAPMPMNGQLRRLARSPYLYGCDITPGALVKRQYMDKFPSLMSPNTVAVSDTETDMINVPHGQNTGEVIMQSITFKDRVYLCIVKSFFAGWNLEQIPQQLQDAMHKYMGEIVEQRGIKLEVELVDNAGQCVSAVLRKAHEWRPDFLSFWNMDFDVTKMEEALTRYGFDLATEWSDPIVPDKYKYYKYKRGTNQKVTASGKSMPLAPAEQWHTLTSPASFYVIDSMCVYLKMRVAGGKKPSYSLNAILASELKGIQKLKFEAVVEIEDGAKWHRAMQEDYKIEYCIYNIFDCIAVEMLDEQTTDLQMQISSQCEHSEYFKFPSQPRRTCDDLHFFVQPHGLICATTSDEMVDQHDPVVASIDGWIITLRSDLTHDDGIELIEELPGFKTQVRRDVADYLLVAGS